MIAWILVADDNVDVKSFLENESLDKKQTWTLNVPETGVKIAELRSWLKTNSLSIKKGELVLFRVNGADNLSEQCQNVLLKPLEESRKEVLFVLTVKSEYGLLPTVVSRCRVIKLKGVDAGEDLGYEEIWNEVVKAWKTGSGASIALLDKWGKDKELLILNFLLVKLANGLRTLPSLKRVRILKLGLELKKDAKLMVNRKMLLGRFLLEGGRIAQLDS